MLRKQFKFWAYEGDGGGTPPTGTPPEKPSTPPAGEPAKPDDTKAELERLKAEKTAWDKDQAELKAFREAKQKEEDAKKTLEQKLADTEAKAKKLERDNLVLKVATEKGLKAELIDRVKGETPEEITADIESLNKLFAGTPGDEAKGGKTQPPKPDSKVTDMTTFLKTGVK